jgi:hypothetical protein
MFEVFRFSTEGRVPFQIFNLCRFELMRLITANLSGSIELKLKECGNCHRLFIKKGNNKTEYCDRLVSGTNRTCKQVGAQKTYRNDHKDDEIRNIYEKEYNTRYRRVHDYKIMNDNEFAKWKNLQKSSKNKL